MIYMRSSKSQTTAPTSALEMLTETQVAHRLGLSIATVRRLRAKNKGPRFRKIRGGASIRYASEDLKRWIEAQPAGGETAE
jgi:predicted DNA-binding transcriptional regulator AlpA